MVRSEVLDFLLAEQLLTTAAVVLEGLRVVKVVGRNQNVLVLTSEGGLFVKRGPPGSGALAREALLLRAFSNDPHMRAVTPAPRAWNATAQLLVQDAILKAHAFSFEQHMEDEHHCASEFGHGLARLHIGQFGPVAISGNIPTMRCLNLTAPDITELVTASPGTTEVVRTVQQSVELSNGLDMVRRSMVASCVIHGDLKPENMLISRAREEPHPVLVDWETAYLGDPAWDLGSVLHGMLRDWAWSSMSLENPMVGCSLAHLRWIREQWHLLMQAYASTVPEVAPSATWVIQNCAARLVQTAYEHARTASIMPPQSAILLQLAENIFEDPSSASQALLERS